MDISSLLWHYNNAEAVASSILPNRIIEASQNAVFDRLGYPSRVSSIKELWKFADAMQEQRAQTTFSLLGEGLTEEEFSLFSTIVKKVKGLTSSYCDRTITPASSLLRAILPFRAIRAFGEKRNILELGPGSGYLGALLLHSGYNYHSVEVSQGFALWQRLLFNSHEGGPCIPWWTWMTEPLEGFSLFTANHALNEMHPWALCFALRRAEAASAPWVIESFGGEVISSNKQTSSFFHKFNYLEAFRSPISFMMPKAKKPPIALPLKLTRSWDDLLSVWGGSLPQTEDEHFFTQTLGPDFNSGRRTPQ